MDYSKLSKEISYILRHNPEEYGLSLDAEGWVDINRLLAALKETGKWDNITKDDIVSMMELSSKKRHEVKGDNIRAYYGHSTSEKIVKEVTTPPDVLFHGTSNVAYESIKVIGLTPQSRQYVHLSDNIETASTVGQRKGKHLIILEIDSNLAFKEGINFYKGNEDVWLADGIPPKYIKKYSI